MGSLAMFRTGEEESTRIEGVHRYLSLFEGHTPSGGGREGNTMDFFKLLEIKIESHVEVSRNKAMERNEFPV